MKKVGEGRVSAGPAGPVSEGHVELGRKLPENAEAVLLVLAEYFWVDFPECLPFKPLMERTGLDRKAVRRACRYLRRRGLAEFKTGLWTDDGRMAGSGYCATRRGFELARRIKEGGEE